MILSEISSQVKVDLYESFVLDPKNEYKEATKHKTCFLVVTVLLRL